MSLVPAEVTRAIVEHELSAVSAWAQRHDVSVDRDLDLLLLTVQLPHPVPSLGHVTLRADLDGYRAVPPAWTFLDADGQVSPRAFPAAGPGLGGSSIFHPHPVICAPFNRLAYTEHEGPHGDWGGPQRWLNVRGVVFAPTLADMLNVVRTHLRTSPGMVA